jgi:hypothetical protein
LSGSSASTALRAEYEYAYAGGRDEERFDVSPRRRARGCEAASRRKARRGDPQPRCGGGYSYAYSYSGQWRS